ncbi:MAG: hypothetical protein PHU21_00700 [Elusimicrobia bacterium]|nr:hypothetical protein [Elusimicrobiota bacterium]
MLPWLAVGLLAAAGAGATAKEDGWTWRETTSPHFAVQHEMPWTPPGFIMNLERMHGRLRMDLGMFSPWMAKERLKLYLYKDSASYLAGEFQPPSWSNGLALYEIKAVAVPDNPDRQALLRVISHETTHLLFEGYWREAGKKAPSWLNEGLAMMEEAESTDRPERSLWFQNMVMAAPSAWLPMEQFFSLNPTEDLKNSTVIGDFYVQAYSMVYFLFRAHQRLQFKNFCAQLRDGRSVEESLWLAYRYRGFRALEKDWRRWRTRSELRKKVEEALAEAPAAEAQPSPGKSTGSFSHSALKPMKVFKSLRD